jgi:hypothetical protein
VVLPTDPVLRFTPAAWAKLLFFCRYGPTEIGGFGITSGEDLLLVQEFQSVHQIVSPVSVAFDDTSVADYFEDQVDKQRRPEQFARIWCHTHPGNSATPSLLDEQTFARVFGSCDWAVMFILARGGNTYARLRFNRGPGGSMVIPVQVDYSASFEAADHPGWELEYLEHVHPEPEILWDTPAEPAIADSLLQSSDLLERLADGNQDLHHLLAGFSDADEMGGLDPREPFWQDLEALP